MIETPSLRTRVIVAGITVIAVATLLLDSIIFVSLRDQLEESLDEVLAARAETAERIGRDNTDPATLAQELTEAGIPAVVRGPDGTVELSQPPARPFDVMPPDQIDETTDTEQRTIVLDSGLEVDVHVSRAGTEGTLRQLLLVEAIGTLALLAFAALVLHRLSAVVTRPVDRIVGVAQRIAAGAVGERIRPSDPTTELGRMAASFDETFDALEEALDEAHRAETASRNFLADAAHQLRTPLAGIRASAEELLRNPKGPDRDRLLANLARESGRASHVVSSLLRMARLERGEALVREHLDLARVIRTECDRAQALAPNLSVTLVGAKEPCPMVGDGEALREAIGNLLDNARHFAGSRIGVTLERGEGLLTVVVEDDGPGVPSGREDEVFERFVSMTGGGAGLGLAITRGIARRHGGDVSASGSRFELLLPTSPLAERARPFDAPPTTERPDFAGRRPAERRP